MTVPKNDWATCYSSISTPLLAFAPYTVRRTYSESSLTKAYWWSTYYRAGEVSTGSYTWTTITNTTLVPSGLAMADAINIGWDATDLSKFPTAYASSLAKKIGVSFTPTALPINPTAVTSPVPGASSYLPRETDSAFSSSAGGLSTGAKAGIGVGAVAGVAAIIGLALLLLCVKRRRKHGHVQAPGNDLPEMVVDHDGACKTVVSDTARGSWRRSQS